MNCMIVSGGVYNSKRIQAHDEGDGHPKSLEYISQSPDCERAPICRLDDRERVESYRPRKHLRQT